MKYAEKEAFISANSFGFGDANQAYAQYFSGQSFLQALTNPETGLGIFNVSFEPGCRNNWHVHKATQGGGQILICTAGEGWYQEEGKPAQELKEGTVVSIPANVKHWHGAKKDSWFSHIAFEVPGENTETEWHEAVSDADYDALEA
ncbi:cupin domain-containing protein [Streptococcus sp. NLN76]|uniref:cupin domain-containing protein n=1 Tax=Streptococcus sp. NLN76 TaxID=2822800 RepID=UPI0018AC894E|nr:cupin domain-containing protein [Streptococcus sp. NLN76]MBF8969997.1 cupin domain-containing protein [Streptococcus sp. NLN76]